VFQDCDASEERMRRVIEERRDTTLPSIAEISGDTEQRTHELLKSIDSLLAQVQPEVEEG
jgi:hypothetical protein